MDRSLGLSDEAPATDNDDVLVAVFADRSSSTTTTAGSGVGAAAHALCVYPVLAVRRKFTETIQKCFNGVGNTGPEHVVVPEPCIRTVRPSSRSSSSHTHTHTHVESNINAEMKQVIIIIIIYLPNNTTVFTFASIQF